MREKNMAKRKKVDDDSGIAGLVLICIFIAFLLLHILIIIPPILAFLYGCWFGIKLYWQNLKIKGSLSDFWLTDEEKAGYFKNLEDFAFFSDQVYEARTIAYENNVKENTDGSYSRRSQAGKRAQDLMDQYAAPSRQANEKVTFYENLPYSRWLEHHEKIHAYIYRFGAGVLSLSVWLVMFIYISNDLNLDSKQLLKEYFANLTFEKKDVNDSVYEAFGTPSLVAIFVFFVSRWIFSKLICKFSSKFIFSPEPPIVNASNIQEY